MKKIAIVTGASSGMGAEFVTQISQRYSKLNEIWIIARRKELLEELAEKITMDTKIFALDLSKDEDIRKLSMKLEEEKPDVKLLVNSAGYGVVGPFELSDYESQIGMIDVNCRALTAVTYLVLPYMGSNSRIIQMASSAAFIPQPDFAVYAATKSYVLSFSRALKRELKEREITVTAVCPGPVKTAFFDIADPNDQKPFYKKMVMANPRRVVEKAIRDCALGDEVSVYGISMKAARFLAKILPTKVLVDFMYRH